MRLMDYMTGPMNYVEELPIEIANVARLLHHAAGNIGEDVPLVYCDIANRLATDVGLADTLIHALRALESAGGI